MNSKIDPKKMFQKRGFINRGSTLIELLIAIVILSFVLVGVYLLWASLAESWMNERAQIKLNADIQIAISQIKKEIRLSTGNEIYYYSDEVSGYTALSFPSAVDNDGDELLELDENNNIIWDKTVIYHLFKLAGSNQLRKTVFNPRYNSLNSDERQEQLESVVFNGNGEETFNSDQATTKILLDQLTSFEIIPLFVIFDAYDPVLKRSDYVNFGSVILTPGLHTLHFEVVGTNSQSSGYFFGIDTIISSQSGGVREAEELLPAIDSSGQLAENVDLSAVGSWSGNAHLLYYAAQEGDYVELEFYHDEWIETNFNHQDSVKNGTDVQFDATLSPSEIVLLLDGMKETWLAKDQTGGMSVPYQANPPNLPLMQGMSVRVIVRSEFLNSVGSRCRILFRAHPSINNLKIQSAYIEERSSAQDGNGSTQQPLYFTNTPVSIGIEQELEIGAIGVGPTQITIPNGMEVYSNWIDFPIDLAKDYLITFYISPQANQYDVSYFPGLLNSVNAYYRSGDFSSQSIWGEGGTILSHIVAVSAVQVTYPGLGVWTSQIYDTKIDNPDFGKITWKEIKPQGTDIHIFLRSSDDPKMEDEPSWKVFSASPSEIPSSFLGRYIQLKAELSTTAPYFESPLLKRNSLRWLGEETIVDIGGYFSQNSDYGHIKLTIDGQELSKAVEVRIQTATSFLEKVKNSDISTEIKPRNTPQ